MSPTLVHIGPGADAWARAVWKCHIEIRDRLPVADPSDMVSFLILTGGLFSRGRYPGRTTPRWYA